MSTISVAKGYAGIKGNRPAISGQQFTEVTAGHAGVVVGSCRIGSFRNVLSVTDWTPDDGDDDVELGRGVQASIVASNTTKQDFWYQLAADFEATGIFTDTAMADDTLGLAPVVFEEDFSNALALDDWSVRWTESHFSITVAEQLRQDGAQYEYSTGLITADNGVYSSDSIQQVDFYVQPGVGAGLAMRINGSGSACRGYCTGIDTGNNYMLFRRITGDGSITTIRASSFPFDDAKWYTIKVWMDGYTMRFKAWLRDTQSEPATWTWGGTDSGEYHPGPGDHGIVAFCNYGGSDAYFDNYSATAIPPEYASASGEWSDSIDVTAVDHFSHGTITWDETTPAGTTLVVKSRWPGGAWQTVTNGATIPDIGYEQDMRAGSTHSTLEIKAEFTTTDPYATATIENLRVYFYPVNESQLELTVEGESYTPSDRLWWYGRGFYTEAGAGTPYVQEEIWTTTFIGTYLPWEGELGSTIDVTLKYWANTVESMSFEVERSRYRLGHARNYWIAFDQAGYESNTAPSWWLPIREWHPGGHDHYWLVIDKSQAIHGDGYWLCGHAVFSDHPVSLTAADLVNSDHPISLLAYGYKRDDTPLSALIQGWQLDDCPISVLPGIWTINDHPVSALAGIRFLNDHPASQVVYGVNREGMIEVNIISDVTWAALDALGYTRTD